MADSENEDLYCICREKYDDTRFMIECDVCNDWFHGSCVEVEERQANDIDKYHCPACAVKHGPLKLKRKRGKKKTLTDYDDLVNTSPHQANHAAFLKNIEKKGGKKPFISGESCYEELKGHQVDIDYIHTSGFRKPILVREKSGLDLRVPPNSFTVADVERYVGSMKELDVIDVAKQSDMKMLMREFVEYYNQPNKDKILNVISLEFSNTKLSDLVVPPLLVYDLSWVHNYWPDSTGDVRTFIKPEVQKYCLMSVKNSYTDFHIDFSGTSVWYHVVRGSKVFYMIEPTDTNLALYEVWASSKHQHEIFFADQVSTCYKVNVSEGETFFIPTGWIHGVYTPADSLVFGGNFLHDYNIKLQISVYGIERRIGTQEKFLFPNFETLCWYTAQNHVEKIKDSMDDDEKINSHILKGLTSLVDILSRWLNEKDSATARRHKDYLPERMSASKIIKDLSKLIIQAQEKSGLAATKSPVVKRKGPPSKTIAKKRTKKSSLKSKTKQPEVTEQPGVTESSKVTKSQPDKRARTKDEDREEVERSALLSLKFKLDKSRVQMDSKPELPGSDNESDDNPIDVDTSIEESPVKSPDPLPTLKYRFSLGGRDINDLTKTSSDNITSPERPLTYADSELPLSHSSPSKDTQANRQLAWSKGLENHNKQANVPQKSQTITNVVQTDTTKLRLGSKLDSPIPAQILLSATKPLIIDEQAQLRKRRTIEERRRKRFTPGSTGGGDEEEEMFNKYYKDDTYVYPALQDSDDEFSPPPQTSRKNKKTDDSTWAPSGGGGRLLPRSDRPIREKARRESVQAELKMSRDYLEEQHTTSMQLKTAKRPYKKKKLKSNSTSVSNPETSPVVERIQVPDHDYLFSTSQPSTSHTTPIDESKHHKIHRALSSEEARKIMTKKRGSTAKQRIGKLLKIHKTGIYG